MIVTVQHQGQAACAVHIEIFTHNTLLYALFIPQYIISVTPFMVQFAIDERIQHAKLFFWAGDSKLHGQFMQLKRAEFNFLFLFMSRSMGCCESTNGTISVMLFAIIQFSRNST